MRVLDLFCGLKGWSKAFEERGHSVVTVDIDSRFEPTICADLLELDYTTLHDASYGWGYDVVLASPPCECFSVASIGTHWTGGHRAYMPKTKAAETAIKLVQHAAVLIEMLKPKFWFMENPRGVLRKMPFMPQEPYRRTITYCQYGETRMKPTDLWGGFPPSLELKPICKNGDPCHERAPRGARTGTQGIKGYANRSCIPYQLSFAVCLACEKDLNVLA